ncbi:hypothetical protein IKE82_00050 [Candidatus Saccharibacteria bacterium]|nr:hypothetical protein [Candidatus Saccharibacteria bacterium]
MVKKHSKKRQHGNLRRQKAQFSPHKSFKRTYREDYVRALNIPGMGQHIYEAFAMLLGHWKMFGGLVVLSTLLMALAMGTLTETTAVFAVLIFLMIWLVTIFLVRHLMAGHKVGLRDGLYNAMTPLLSSLVVFVVIVVECLPICLVMIAYAAAVKTEFFSMPFYALLFFVFAGLMIVLSGYLLSSSLIALIAVSAPGLYPWKALTTASELMMGRRIRFILRLIALGLVLGVIWAVVILPLAALKLPMEVLSVVMALLGCFSSVYATIYLYLYYRYLLKA